MNEDLFFLCTDPETVNKHLMETEGITLEEFLSKETFVSHRKRTPYPEPQMPKE